jgi:hypothetical protein
LVFWAAGWISSLAPAYPETRALSRFLASPAPGLELEIYPAKLLIHTVPRGEELQRLPKATAMAIATDSPAQQIVNDIHAHIQKCGGQPSEWYVGIADSTDRLFIDHNVSRASGQWIFRTAETSAIAREVERAFHNAGYAGGPGGGDYNTKMVYAYRITSTTRE